MPYSKKFTELLAGTEEYYTGKPVPQKYQKEYGKIYSKEEAKSIAFKIAKKRGWNT
jgi:hypothetical protein